MFKIIEEKTLKRYIFIMLISVIVKINNLI